MMAKPFGLNAHSQRVEMIDQRQGIDRRHDAVVVHIKRIHRIVFWPTFSFNAETAT